MKIDDVADRILTLAYTSLHSYSNYLKQSHIGDTPEFPRQLWRKLFPRRFQNFAGEGTSIAEGSADAEGTNALMSDYIREQEESVRMSSSFSPGSKGTLFP